MGRLEDIIARNRSNKPREKTVVMIGFGVIVLIVLALMVFTNLGRPPVTATEHRVDDVQIRKLPQRPVTK